MQISYICRHNNRRTMFKKLTTYLTLASTLLTGAMFFLPFAKIIGPDNECEIIMYYEKIPYLVMLIMLISGSMFTVLTHKMPLLQARVCMLTGLMLIGFQIWLGADFIKWHNEVVFSVTMLFPTAAAALEIIAARKATIDGVTIQAVKNMKRR